ncbi:MAG: ABC transporter permease [Gammaproteobacteria bacterium]|nr:ABC transporter permease [Gammaproteobacteria bacterium]
MDTILRDLRYVLRSLARRPGYAALVIAVFALALGANTTVFSVFNGLFLRPLPYPEGDRLVAVFNVYPKMNLPFAGTSIPDYLDRRERAPSLADLAIYTGIPRTLGGSGSPLRILVARVSPSLFNVLGSAPELGRLFTDAESTPGADRVAVVSQRLWRDRFGGRTDALGSDLELDGERYQVIGVMPDAFGFPDRTMDVWVPFAFTPEQISDVERGREFSGSIGRLRPGATIAGLQRELDAIVQQNVASGRLPQGAEYLERSGFAGRAEPLRDRLVGNYRQTLAVLQGLVLAVLLIACANVANLQLARLLSRSRELAIRSALGAERKRIARLVLSESLLLALFGASAGCVLATGGLALIRQLGVDLSSQGLTFTLDGTVFAVTGIVAVLAAIASSVLPLTVLLRADLGRTVQEAGRLGDGGPRARLLRGVLVSAQIAVSVALLAGAGLLLEGFQQLQRDGTGFHGEQVWSARIALPERRYASMDARTRFYDRALEQLRAVPGVTQAGLTSALPFSGNNSLGSFSVAGYTPPPGVAPPHAQKRSISDGFLPALDVPVIRGRNFTANEPEPVAIVDQNLAAKYWPDTDPIGQRIGDAPTPEASRWFTVIGVVPPLKHAALTEEPNKETIYWHYRHKPEFSNGAFTLRTTLAPEQLTRAATAAIAAIDPDLALYDVMPLAERVTRSLGPQRTPMVLTQLFAAIAFTLAVVGVYGVLTFSVTQRSGEIGVRMALGARGADIVRLVLRQGTHLLLAGLVAGTVGALALGRLLASRLPAVAAADAVVFVIAIAGVTAATLIACWLPARRAARIDPLRALRAE